MQPSPTVFAVAPDLPEEEQARLAALEERLHALWAFGRNLLLTWTPSADGIDVLVIPHYVIAEFAAAGDDNTEARQFIESVIAGPKLVTGDGMEQASSYLGRAPVHVSLDFVPGDGLSLRAIDAAIQRYSLSYVEDRAVALFDVVGFSKHLPLEQVTQLNSLAYSVNAAYSKMLDKSIDLQFARTTTGDGFYIWNRERSVEANVFLYHLMHLVMADNAVARTKAKGNTTPLLRTCFHIGGHYEFYQSEGLSPTIYSYIVGDVTIELARMCERALPGQVIVGDFDAPIRVPQGDDIDSIHRINAVEFIERTQATLSSLEGLVLSGDGIESIKCYLTGMRQSDGSFSIKRYRIRDKHGFSRLAYNAKINIYRHNIYRHNADPIFLGIQDNELDAFEVVEDRAPDSGGVG